MIKEIKTENAGTFAEKLMEHVMLLQEDMRWMI